MSPDNSLRDQHDQLRRRLEEMGALLGREQGVGWDDCSDCDMPRFRSVLTSFLRELRLHEAAETRALSRLLNAPAPGRRELKRTYAKSHETLDHLVRLLSTAAAIDHEGHVYSVRSIGYRVRQELESHFAYEELEILPLMTHEPAR